MLESSPMLTKACQLGAVKDCQTLRPGSGQLPGNLHGWSIRNGSYLCIEIVLFGFEGLSDIDGIYIPCGFVIWLIRR